MPAAGSLTSRQRSQLEESMEVHLDQDLSLEQMAEVAQLSATRLNQAFGTTPLADALA